MGDLLPRVQVIWHAYQVGKSLINCEHLLPSNDCNRLVAIACGVAERLSVSLDCLTEHATSCDVSSSDASCPCSGGSPPLRRRLWDDGLLDDNEALVARLALSRACDNGKEVPDNSQHTAGKYAVGMGICEGMLSVVLERKVSLEEEELSDVLLGAPIHKVRENSLPKKRRFTQ
eukprot:9499661-Pyramimonas_sp.AAC.3